MESVQPSDDNKVVLPPRTALLTAEELKNLYFTITQVEGALGSMKEQLRTGILTLFKGHNEVLLEGGFRFVLEKRITREYDKSSLRLIFDADQLDEVMKPDTKAVRAMLKRLDIPQERISELEQNMVEVKAIDVLRLLPPSKESRKRAAV